MWFFFPHDLSICWSLWELKRGKIQTAKIWNFYSLNVVTLLISPFRDQPRHFIWNTHLFHFHNRDCILHTLWLVEIAYWIRVQIISNLCCCSVHLKCNARKAMSSTQNLLSNNKFKKHRKHLPAAHVLRISPTPVLKFLFFFLFCFFYNSIIIELLLFIIIIRG